MVFAMTPLVPPRAKSWTKRKVLPSVMAAFLGLVRSDSRRRRLARSKLALLEKGTTKAGPSKARNRKTYIIETYLP
jgi:hypothetical protein